MLFQWQDIQMTMIISWDLMSIFCKQINDSVYVHIVDVIYNKNILYKSFQSF